MDEKENEKQDKESEHYFLFIYWNPQDKRVFVPKRWGYGWTINFANPVSIAVLVVLVVLVTVLLKLL